MVGVVVEYLLLVCLASPDRDTTKGWKSPGDGFIIHVDINLLSARPTVARLYIIKHHLPKLISFSAILD
jgi:hypothetical protein